MGRARLSNRARLSDAERSSRMASSPGAVAAGLVLALRRARMDAGVSQRALAAKIGVAAITVRDWETGDDAPLTRHLFGWARAVGCRVVLVDRHGARPTLALERWPGEDLGRFETRRVGAIFKRERLLLRMTQPEVARLAGTSLVSLCRGEQRGPARGSLLVSWAAAVGFSVHVVRDRQETAGL